LLATLGHQITRLGASEFNVSLLSHSDDLQARYLPSRQALSTEEPPPPISKRTTQELIAFERQAFESALKDDTRDTHKNQSEGKPHSQHSPQSERAYFWGHFATSGPLKGKRKLIFQALPSALLMNERTLGVGLNATLREHLHTEVLTLLIDGPKAVEALETKASGLVEYTRYQQALQYYLDHDHHRPLWLVVSKADRLAEPHRDEAWWRAYALTYVTPLLKMSDHEVELEVSLVSADETDELARDSLKKGLTSLLTQLKATLKRRHELREERLKVRTPLVRLSLAIALLLGGLMWASVGAYQISTLSSLSGERAWDSESLKRASEPRLTMLTRSASVFSPLSLFQARLRQDLKTLRVAHWRLVRLRADQWGQTLEITSQTHPAQEGLSQERERLAGELKRVLADATRFNTARSAEVAWSAEEHLLSSLVEEAVKLTGSREVWGERCQRRQTEAGATERPFECSLEALIKAQEAKRRQEEEAKRRRAEQEAQRSPSLNKPLITEAMEWQLALKEGLQDATPQRFDQALERVERALEQHTRAPQDEATQAELTLWGERLKELRAWRHPESVSLTLSEVTCDFERLNAEGLKHGAGTAWWDLDVFSPYLMIKLKALSGEEPHSEEGELLVEGERADDGLSVIWTPWTPISFKLYERDGDFDALEGVKEYDDHLIGEQTWRPQGAEREKVLHLTPQGSCKVAVVLHHPLPQWATQLLNLTP
jgi:hypothetical protein